MTDLDYKQLWQQTKNFISLKYEYSKLTFAEKLSILLAKVLIVSVTLILGLVVLLFLSGALVSILTELLESAALAYAIVAAIYLVLILLIYAFKTALIINPVTRFVTKLFFTLDAGENNENA